MRVFPVLAGLSEEVFYFDQKSKLTGLNRKRPNDARQVDNINYPKTKDTWATFRRQQQFAVRWTGFVAIEDPGSYKFFLSSDDGSRMLLEDRMLVDNDGLHGCKSKDGTKTLSTGTHKIRIEYFQKKGHACAILEYQGPDSNNQKKVMPKDVLKRAAGLPTGTGKIEEAETAGHLRTKEDNRCLDYNKGNKNVYMHKCHKGKNQFWSIDADGHLKTKQDNKCLDYNKGNKNVYMHKCHNGKNQKWYVDSKGRMKTKEDNKCLDYNAGNKNVYMHRCHNGKNQKWYFKSKGAFKPKAKVCQRWDFVVNSKNDLIAIKMGPKTGSKKTEVHRMTASSNYGSYDLQTRTALGYSTHAKWAFVIDSKDNIVCIKKGPRTGSKKTEVHRLSASSDYTKFDLQTGTGLEYSTGKGVDWAFTMDSKDNLVCIKMGPTGSKKTEVHILTRSSNYRSFNLHRVSGLHYSYPGAK